MLKDLERGTQRSVARAQVAVALRELVGAGAAAEVAPRPDAVE